MPEPRLIHMGGEIIIGYRGGGGQSFSPYGHTRGQVGFKDEKRERRETKALNRFQAEWAIDPEYQVHGIQQCLWRTTARG